MGTGLSTPSIGNTAGVASLQGGTSIARGGVRDRGIDGVTSFRVEIRAMMTMPSSRTNEHQPVKTSFHVAIRVMTTMREEAPAAVLPMDSVLRPVPIAVVYQSIKSGSD